MTRRSSKGRRRGRRASRRSYVALVAALIVLLGGLLYLLVRMERGREAPALSPPLPASAPGELPATRSAVLFFGSEDAEGLLQELREVRAAEGAEEQARLLVEELIRGPGAGGLPVIPEGTELHNAYFDGESGCLYLDFSREMKTHHWGGSAAELLTIRSLLATVGANIPRVRLVQLLIQGEEVESLAGHVSTRQPFEVGAWSEMGGEVD